MASVIEHAAVLGRQLIDPRGRCNRQGLLALTVVALVLQTVIMVAMVIAGQSIMGPLSLALNAPLFWIGAMAIFKRLHDMGRTGWWLPAMVFVWIAFAFAIAFAAVALYGPAVVAEGTTGFAVLCLMATLPAFGGLLYLQAAPGETAANKYGEVPGPLGFSPAAAREALVPSAVTA